MALRADFGRLEADDGAIRPYLRAIRAHPLLVALVTLAALLASVVWSALRAPEYEASAQILLTPLPQDDRTFLGLQLLRDSNDPTRTVQTAATLVESAPGAAELTALRLGGGWDRQAVLESVVVEPEGESNILAVTGTAEEATTAARLANQFARAALDARGKALRAQVERRTAELEARERTGKSRDTIEAETELAQLRDQLETFRRGADPTLSLSQPASAPAAPAGAALWLVALLSLLAGFALGSGAALLAELLDPRVREEREALTLYPLPVLSRIPDVSHAAAGAAIASPVSMPPAVREAFRAVQAQLKPPHEAGPCALMVTSASSGDGKTTCAVNLAFALVTAGHRVILLDLDLRKPDLGGVLGIGHERGLASLLTQGSQLADVLVQAPQLPPLRVAVAGTDGDVVAFEALTRRLPELIAEARDLADYVVLDSPPLGEVSDALTAAEYVDDLLLVTRPGHTDRAGLERVRDLLERAERRPLGMLVVGGAGATKSHYYAYGSAWHRNGAGPAPLARALRR